MEWVEGGAPDDDDEEEAAAGVGRACGVSEEEAAASERVECGRGRRRRRWRPAWDARAVCPRRVARASLRHFGRGSAEMPRPSRVPILAGSAAGNLGAREEEEERGVSSGAGRGASEFALRRAVCCVWVSEAPCCARAAEGAPGVLALRVHFGDVWVARAQVLEAVHIEGEPAA